MNSVVFELVTCIKCNNVQTRGKIGAKYKNRHYKYHDDNGRAWKGNKCPGCASLEHRLYQRERRQRKNMLNKK